MLTEIFLFLATFLLSIVLLESVYLRKKSHLNNYPPSIPSIPFLGSLPFMMNAAGHMPKFFLKKSEELGPIFTLKIGNKLCLILNSFEAIEDAFVKKSSVFSGRQVFYQETYMGNPNRKGIVAGYFNAYWKYHQRLSLSILREFGFGNNNAMERRISQEVMELMKVIQSKDRLPFCPKELLLQTSANLIHQILFADRVPYHKGLNPLYQMAAQAIDNFILTFEVAPWIRFFPYFRQIIQASVDAGNESLRLIKEFVDDVKSGGREECFVSKYFEKEGLECDFEQLSFIIRDLAFAATDTTGTTMLWSLFFLANHLDIQKRLQAEIDEAVPRSRLPGFEDKQRLSYVEAFILEVLRTKTLLPLAIPHQTMSDTNISGYFVPAGTMVMPNLYAAHMDRKFWKDPETFRPERFLDETNNIINKDRCIPFSLGRRSCLGEVLARQELFQVISGLIQNFSVFPPENQKTLDVREITRVFLKPSKFKVRMIYRDE